MGLLSAIIVLFSSFHISHSFFSTTEKEMRSVILEFNVLGTWVFQLRAKTKNHSMNSITRENCHDSLGNVQVVLSWLGINVLLVPFGIKLFLFNSPELLPKSFYPHQHYYAFIWMNGRKANTWLTIYVWDYNPCVPSGEYYLSLL